MPLIYLFLLCLSSFFSVDGKTSSVFVKGKVLTSAVLNPGRASQTAFQQAVQRAAFTRITCVRSVSMLPPLLVSE